MGGATQSCYIEGLTDLNRIYKLCDQKSARHTSFWNAHIAPDPNGMLGLLQSRSECIHGYPSAFAHNSGWIKPFMTRSLTAPTRREGLLNGAIWCARRSQRCAALITRRLRSLSNCRDERAWGLGAQGTTNTSQKWHRPNEGAAITWLLAAAKCQIGGATVQ